MSKEKEVGLLEEYLRLSEGDKIENESNKIRLQSVALVAVIIALMYFSHTQGYSGIANYALAAIAGYIVSLARHIRSSGWELTVICRYLDRESMKKRIEELRAQGS